jgi:hypothetical protein
VRQVESERMHKWRRDPRQPRPIRRTELRHSGLRGSSEATRMRPLVETGKRGSAVLTCVRSGRGHFLSSASCVRKVSVERGIRSASTCLTSNLPINKTHKRKYNQHVLCSIFRYCFLKDLCSDIQH